MDETIEKFIEDMVEHIKNEDGNTKVVIDYVLEEIDIELRSRLLG